MLVKNFVYCASLVISLLSIASISYSIVNKDKKNNKYIIIVNITYMLYLIILNLIMHEFLPIICGLEIVIIWLIAIIAGIIYLISTIICKVKSKKLVVNNNKNIFVIPLILIISPIILFTISLFREIYLINNSTILLSLDYRGNGTIGSSASYTYVMNDKYFKEISFYIDNYNKLFLPKNAKEVSISELEELGFNIFIDDNSYINVYKNNKLIHKVKIIGDLENIIYNKQ